MMDLLIGAAATFRLTFLLLYEDGPFNSLKKFQEWGATVPLLADILDCFYCSSIWVGMAIAIAIGASPGELALDVLAFSGLSILVYELLYFLKGEVPDGPAEVSGDPEVEG